jgi:cytosine deaminase
VKARAWKTLKWQIANGIQFVRTHVDVSDPTLTALKAMLEVKQEVAPWVELQIVAFPQEGILSYPNGEALLEEALKLGADVVGRSRTLSSPVNMAWNRCISLSVWRRNMTARWIFTAMKLTTNSRGLSKPWPRWR